VSKSLVEQSDLIKCLESSSFKVLNFSVLEENPVSYFVTLSFASQGKLECLLKGLAAEAITKEKLKEGSRLKILKYILNDDQKSENEEIVVTEIKILAPSSKQQQLNAFSQLKFLARHVFQANEKSNFDMENLEKKFQEFSNQNPFSTTLSGFGVSTIMGFVAAYLIGRVIKALVLAVGAYLLSLQALSASGFVTINWDRVKNFLLNLNFQKASKLFGLSTMGFSLGFYLGVRREMKKILQ